MNSTYCESALRHLQNIDGDVDVTHEAKAFDPMRQVLVTDSLEHVEGPCVHLGVVKMVTPVTQSVPNMGREVIADAHSKIGNVPVKERNLIWRNSAHVPAENACHRFQAPLCEHAVVFPGLNRQIMLCTFGRINEEIGERGMDDLYGALLGRR